jgi:DnaK suppressor protein
MNINEFENRLREKERELLADIARTEAEARESRVAEVEDLANGSISSESKESLLQQTTVDWKVLTQVRDALQRIENGAYGKCLDCGRQIEANRLNSLPWVPYCLADEERHDREEAVQPS